MEERAEDKEEQTNQGLELRGEGLERAFWVAKEPEHRKGSIKLYIGNPH